jgi:hypothetical protein
MEPAVPDPAMSVAAIHRLVHHATTFEMNVESYRRRTALERKNNTPSDSEAPTAPRRPPRKATRVDRC